MKKCPVCGNKELERKSWSDEGRTVETVERCTKCNNYSDEWAYGNQSFYLNGRTWEFTDHPFIKGKDAITAEESWGEIYDELIKCMHYVKED
jgi:hypothetical protein